MEGIHQNLSLAVSAVRKLDLRSDSVFIGILGFAHTDLKWYLLPESQFFQLFRQCICPDFQRCLGKINVV